MLNEQRPAGTPPSDRGRHLSDLGQHFTYRQDQVVLPGVLDLGATMLRVDDAVVVVGLVGLHE